MSERFSLKSSEEQISFCSLKKHKLGNQKGELHKSGMLHKQVKGFVCVNVHAQRSTTIG